MEKSSENLLNISFSRIFFDDILVGNLGRVYGGVVKEISKHGQISKKRIEILLKTLGRCRRNLGIILCKNSWTNFRRIFFCGNIETISRGIPNKTNSQKHLDKILEPSSEQTIDKLLKISRINLKINFVENRCFGKK